jgi:hypothetical protein
MAGLATDQALPHDLSQSKVAPEPKAQHTSQQGDGGVSSVGSVVN